MPIMHSNNGGTTITGDSITFFRLAAWKGAVSLERAGLQVRRGPKIWRQIAKQYGIKGGIDGVWKWLNDELDRLRPLQEHVDANGHRTVGGQEVH